MNGQEFLANMPQLPPRPEWTLAKDFLPLIGEVDYSKKEFLGNSGGGYDPDSFRGFGATSQQWKIPTSNSWTVYYDDNGRGIYGARDPQRTLWTKSQFKMDRSQRWDEEYFIENAVLESYKTAREKAVETRRAYMFDHPQIPLRFEGYYLQENTWWIHNSVGCPTMYRINSETNYIPDLCYKEKEVHAPWYRDRIPYTEIF